MLQQSILQTIIILLSVFILCGCEANYTITIDKNNITEKIEVLDNVSSTKTVTDIMDNYKKQYPVYSNSDWVEADYSRADNEEYYNQTYNIDDNGYHLFYEYAYPIEKFKEANSLNYSYEYKDITYKNNILSIAMGSPNNRLKYVDEFTNLTVNIITDYIVTNNNADLVVGNRYIWYVNKENNDTKKINFEVDLTQTQKELENKNTSKEEKKRIVIPILIGFLLLYVIIIFFMVTKKRRNEG